MVQVRPARLDAAERAVGSVEGIVVRSRDARGKLFVAVEPAAIATALCALAQLPDVLSTNLVNTVGFGSEVPA